MTGQRAYRANGRMVAGVILVLLGIVYALQSFGVLYAGDVLRFWPLILVGIGITKVMQARWAEQRTAGLILVAIGVVLLLWTLHFVWFRGRDIWPVLLLLIGGGLIWQAMGRRGRSLGDAGPGGGFHPAESILADAREELASLRGSSSRPPETGVPGGEPAKSVSAAGSPPDPGSYLNEFAFMGGGDRIVRTQDFRGGEVTAIMGGFAIDLRGAAIAGDSATIHVFALWGGVEFKVPEDWNVAMAGVPILGGFTNSARSFRQGDAAAKTLIVKGTAVMGGVEVKN